VNILYARTVAVICAAALLTGCGAPKGDTGGRIDPYSSTDSDRRSSRASIPAMLEFGDQVSAGLAQQISEIEAVQRSQDKLVLELGSIDNHTSTPTTDFEQLRNRIRGQIFRSRLIRDNFLIVEGRQRMEAERQRVSGDTAQQAAAGTARYDPALTYVLQGDFYESVRGSRRQYYMEFKLTNLASREIVFQETFDLAQR
jgi:TolA-binding protein